MHFGYWKVSKYTRHKGGYLYDGFDWDRLEWASLVLYFSRVLPHFSSVISLFVVSIAFVSLLKPLILYMLVLHNLSFIYKMLQPSQASRNLDDHFHIFFFLRMSTENQNVEERLVFEAHSRHFKDIKWRFQLQLKRHFLSLKAFVTANSSPIKCMK